MRFTVIHLISHVLVIVLRAKILRIFPHLSGTVVDVVFKFVRAWHPDDHWDLNLHVVKPSSGCKEMNILQVYQIVRETQIETDTKTSATYL